MENTLIRVILKLMTLLTPSGVDKVFSSIKEDRKKALKKARGQEFVAYWLSPVDPSESLYQCAKDLLGLDEAQMEQVRRIGLIQALHKKAPYKSVNSELLERLLTQYRTEMDQLRNDPFVIL